VVLQTQALTVPAWELVQLIVRMFSIEDLYGRADIECSLVDKAYAACGSTIRGHPPNLRAIGQSYRSESNSTLDPWNVPTVQRVSPASAHHYAEPHRTAKIGTGPAAAHEMAVGSFPPVDERTIVCVQAGNVNTGAFDPILEICERAHSRDAWVHVDGLLAAGYSVLNDVVLNQVLVSFGNAERTREVIKRIQDEGTCWCGGTVWQGQTAMRISVSSWATTEADVERSLAAILRVAAS
jgi:hypothetical protein